MPKILTLVEENKLILLNGTVNYGHDYGKATYHKTTDGIVTISGLVKSQEYGLIAQLPEGYRPNKQLVFNVNNNYSSCRVDVLTDGRIMWINGDKCHGYGNISLSGINFYVGEDDITVPLENNWVAYGDVYGTPTYVKTSDNIVVVSGVVKDGIWGLIGQLPAGYRPTKRLVFNLNNNTSSCRVDVLTDGRIMWITGGRHHGWISLSGIIFSLDTGENITLSNYWRTYGNEYGNPTFKKTEDGLVNISGLIVGGKPGVLAQLPSWCCPTKRLVFNMRNSSGTSRIDVLTDGRIIWIKGSQCTGYLSLSGINFYTEYTSKSEINLDDIIGNETTFVNINATNIETTDLTVTDTIDTDHINSVTITNAAEITSDTFITTSDARLKKNVREIDNCVNKVKLLRGVNFNWIKDNREDFGVIAQEVEAVAPHAVKENKEGTKHVDYSKLTVLLIQAIKEQQHEIDALKSKIAGT